MTFFITESFVGAIRPRTTSVTVLCQKFVMDNRLNSATDVENAEHFYTNSLI